MRKKKGFTLMELLVVIAIIGVLTGAAVFSMRYMTKDTSVTNGVNSIVALGNYAQKYAISNSKDDIVMSLSNSGEDLFVRIFEDKDGNSVFSSGDQLILSRVVKKVNYTAPPRVNGKYVLPCGNFTVSNLTSAEASGVGICITPSITFPEIRYNRLGIPVDPFGAPMPCHGFIVLTSSAGGSLRGVEFNQSGFVSGCRWSESLKRWIK